MRFTSSNFGVARFRPRRRRRREHSREYLRRIERGAASREARVPILRPANPLLPLRLPAISNGAFKAAVTPDRATFISTVTVISRATRVIVD